MPTSFDQILKALSRSREAVRPSSEPFPQIDVEQVASTLRLAARGTSDGKSSIPNGDPLSAAESDIEAEILSRASKARDELLSQVNLYEGRIRRGLISAELQTSIEAAGQRALGDLIAQTTDDLNRLQPYCEEVRGRHREFVDFRNLHHLQRLPAPRKQVGLRWMFIALLILVEAIANGLFFAKGSDRGLIGGVTQALVFSGLNIGLAVAFARYAFPYSLHARRAVRMLGLFSLPAWLISSLVLNLAIGHFRELFMTNEGQVRLAELATRLSSGLMSFSDSESLILAGLGFAFSLAAVLDASGLDDPYPGYGPVGRRRADAIGEFSGLRSECVERLQNTRDEAVDSMSTVIRDLRAQEHDVELARGGLTLLHQNYAAFRDHLRATHTRLTQRYREANLAARTTPPATRWNQIHDVLPEPGFSQKAPLPAPDPDALQRVVERMEYFIRTLKESCDSELKRYPTVEELTATGAGEHRQ